ncbi:MAG: 4-carboxymuconolactone decarboxylase [Betaproteobacteria bacterium]|nr:4-carboxymuconolactone decarboxylase [Betaproteobacteria bacterium]
MNSENFDKGLLLRSQVMGKAYTDSAFASASEHDRELQALVTEFGWGAVWARPGLPPPFRSMLTIALLAALNRPEELKNHIRGALNNGVTRDQVFEVMVHVMPYCGAPATLGGWRIAKAAFAEHDAQAGIQSNRDTARE